MLGADSDAVTLYGTTEAGPGGVVTGTDGGSLDLMGGTVLATTPALDAELVEALRPGEP